MEINKKKCNSCLNEKTVGDFYSQANTKDRLTTRCKSCIIAGNKSRREENKSKQKEYPKQKTCGCCNEALPVNLFTLDAGSSDGLGFLCKPCAKVKSKKRRLVGSKTKLGVKEKQCNECHLLLPVSCFYNCNGTPDGMQYKCKSCQSKKAKHFRKTMRERVIDFDKPKQKRCRQCKSVKAIIDFGANRTTKDGLSNECRDCVKKNSKAKHDKNKLSFLINKIPEFSTCHVCKLTKHSQYFRIDKTKSKGISNKCKSCEIAYNSKRIKENPMLAVAFSHRRRVKLKAAKGSLSAEQILLRFKYHGNKCFYCGSLGKMTADHRIPISRGGSNWPSNIVPACKSCNSRKHTKTETEFREWLIGYRQ